MKLKAPYPYFGGKSKVADEVWSRFGRVNSYTEPFFGSGAVLLARPTPFPGVETVNDKDHFIANFWRALKADPEGLAEACNWPVNETDLHARHVWLVTEGAKLITSCYDNPNHFDLQVAAWWVWGLSQWIGTGWCQSTWNSRPHLTQQTQGIHSVAQQRQNLTGYGDHGVNAGKDRLLDWFHVLADRLRDVRVCCGSWERVCGSPVLGFHGLAAVFLDPPYTAKAGRDAEIYSTEDTSVGHQVAEWCLANGDNPNLRIALCGYEGEYEIPSTWETFAWKAGGGYASIGHGKGIENRAKERIWFSPHCLKAKQQSLF